MTMQVNLSFNPENNERVENEFRNEEMKTWRIMKESTSSRRSIMKNRIRGK